MESLRLRSVPMRPKKKIRNHVSPKIHSSEIQNEKPPSIKAIFVEVSKEFVSESSIHGIKYIAIAKTRLERIFWICVLIISLLSAVQLANKFYVLHQEGNMRTLVIDNQYPAWKIPVPAITICHPNLISRSRVSGFLASNKNLKLPAGLTIDDFINSLSHLREVFHPTNNYADQLDKLHEILVLNNISLEGLLKITSPSCDYIVTCRYEGKMQNCKSLLKRSLMSSGYCCSFNYEYNNNPNERKITRALHSFKYGGFSILSMMIKNMNSSDRIASHFQGNGVKIIIDNRYTYPGSLSHEFIVNTNYEVIAKIRPRPITASKNVLDSSMKDRKCFKTLGSKTPYKIDNCLANCRENLQRKLCGCVPFYASTIFENDTICDLVEIGCLARAKMSVLSLTPQSKSCNCYPACEEDTFIIETNSLALTNSANFNPSPFYRIRQDYPQAMALHFTYAKQVCMLQRREIVLSWINLVSSLGGVFSLFLGCSFISLFEFIYFFGYFLWKIIKRRDHGGQSKRRKII